MPKLKSDLARLVAIPSVSASGFPAHTHEALLEANREILRLFADAGFETLGSLELPDTAPVIVGETAAPAGIPTVLLHPHYDVVPAGAESEWHSPPFVASERDGAIYGRGAADSKSNILVHLGAIRAWKGRPPVGVKLLLEGQEEVGNPLGQGYALANPEPFACDAMLIADGGNMRPGLPSLTTSLRSDAAITVAARTLGAPKHSGQYGGAAPDALNALLRGLASLHDEHGGVAVHGLDRSAWTGVPESEAEFRELAEVLRGVPLTGSGDLGERIWTKPAITVTGLDAPSVDRGGERGFALRPRAPERSCASRAGSRRRAGCGDRAPAGPASVRDRARGAGG